MCGIAGWANLDSKRPSQNTDEAVLHSMCNRMIHRGPDSEGVWFDKSVVLGMRRLSIIDLHTGEQPVYSEDRSIVAVMNGELYNFREVRDGFGTGADTFLKRRRTRKFCRIFTKNSAMRWSNI
jgi:asparagine synthase (glutamine-hydrolysing)